MANAEQEPQIDFKLDKTNLYREESITDLKVATIKKLVPVKSDGTDDESRTPIFVGNTQLMSPQGPVPLQAPLTANSLEEALDAFPDAMQVALEKMVERVKKMQQEQQKTQQQQQPQMQPQEKSRIIMPGR